ncbi:galectin-9-like isoform X1 [Labeo rohita]|uniref:Galectin n=1 Tax=Labeo rohita TaxID=84645 RepID=A0A498N193_LABRO|nr:galectin-9-like isoform X1 [Labeo rohita]
MEKSAAKYYIKFQVDLQYGSDIVLHFNPRYDRGGTLSKTISTNGKPSYVNSICVGGEVIISCTQNHYEVFVNGKQAHTYKHHTKLEDIDVLEISGDVQLSFVQD